MRTTALLALEDGAVFKGQSCGAEGEASGEAVFNTSMTGYQEILTDPSYKGQLVAMTYPQIGNYGITAEDNESRQPFLSGLVVRELCRKPSNWQAVEPLEATLRRHGIVAIEGIDTRALTLRLREKGAERALREGVEILFPPPRFCTDNAAMVAGLGYHLARAGRLSDLKLDAVATKERRR